MRSSRHIEKHGKHCEVSSVSDGTAARTRPLSFDEVVSRRENKDSSENVKKGNVEEESKIDGTLEKASGLYESERTHYRHYIESSHGMQKLQSELFVSGGSRKKEDNTYREGRLGKLQRREHASEMKTKAAREYHASETKLRAEREGRGSETKMRDKREGRASQTKIRDGRGSRASQTKIRDKRKGPASPKLSDTREVHDIQIKMRAETKKSNSAKTSETIDEHIHSRQMIHERTSNALENETGRKRLRSIIVMMDGPRDGSSGKSENERERKYQNGDDQRSRDRKTSKKPDLEKMHNTEISEREEKKEQPKWHHLDMREKRKRSRSRDREQDKDRRPSLSPRAHRTATYRREYEELSQDRSGKHHSNNDRNRTTNNSSHSHSKRHNESRSGLGGYSPRKRRAEAPVILPPPANCSPEKISAKWDLAPQGPGSCFSGSVFPNSHSAIHTVSTAVNEVASAVLKPLTGVSFWTPPTNITASVDSVQLTESTRPMRRLYVENVPDSASDKSLVECFNDYLLSLGSNYVQGSKPCISCILNKEKGQALVEFLTPEYASSALSFDGCSFAGSILEIRRPKDFVEVSTGELEKTEAVKDALSDIVKDSANKIFIGGISKALSSEMLMEIVSVFGALKAYHYEINQDLNEPCVFLEYADKSATLKACAGLNGMKLGGNVISVVQACPDVPLGESSENLPFYGIPEQAKPLLSTPTHVLKLKNVFDPEGLALLSELEVEEILEDIRSECNRFGTVKSINLVKDRNNKVTTTAEAYAADGPKTASSDETMITRETSEFSSHPSEETSVIEGQRNYNEAEKADGTFDVVNPTDNGLVVETAEDLAHKHKVEAISEENTDGPITSKVESFANTKYVNTENQTARTKLSSGNHSKYSPEDIVGSEDNVTRQLSSVEKVDDDEEQKSNLSCVFEPGCVLVEYGRPEASCTAAHSLHRRLFDNRVVTVEYVLLDHYCTRFPK